jgi:predicted PhzF superfamily epimerase YddE/YHI9
MSYSVLACRFVSHMQMGIPEDPVTGSAHAVLGPYWSSRLGGKGAQQAGPGDGGRSKVAAPAIVPLQGHQCSKRGGELAIEVHHCQGCVLVSGSATVMVAGELRL